MTEFLICSFSNSKTFDYICGHRVNDKTYKVLNLVIFLKVLGISNCATGHPA